MEKFFIGGKKKVFINMLTVCNNGRVAVTIEVEILAFPREGGRSSDPAKIFLWI